MLTWKAGLHSVLSRTPIGPQQRVQLEQADSRILARPLIAPHDSPLFDSSSVDGFGVHPSDVTGATRAAPVCLRIADTVRAGDARRLRLRRGTAVKLLTGASIPSGVGGVVMKEFCREDGNFVFLYDAVKPGENIRRRGGEFLKGQEVLPAGVKITPPVVGLLASLGCATVTVHVEPAVTILVTGDELLSVDDKLHRGKVRDANSYALRAAVRALGIKNFRTLRLGDRPALLRKGLANALRRSDVLLTVGGVSVGEYDYVRPLLKELGVKQIFWRLAIKPGKPIFFGLYDHKYVTRSGPPRRPPGLVFGLPGNPVSALVGFHQLVKPALLKMMGMAAVKPLLLQAKMCGKRQKKDGRLEWLRGVVRSCREEIIVKPTAGRDSHMLSGLARANCLIRFPAEADCLADGEGVMVEPLRWQE